MPVAVRYWGTYVIKFASVSVFAKPSLSVHCYAALYRLSSAVDTSGRSHCFVINAFENLR
jgi:hypothetical protein